MRKLAGTLYAFLLYVFLYAPILVLIVFSFNASKSRGTWDGFTLKWYLALLEDRQIVKALYYTLSIAVISAVVSTAAGTLSAIGIHGLGRLEKAAFLNVNYIPVLNPDIVTGIAMMSLFLFVRLKLGFLTMLLAHITFCIPYVILAVLPKLRQMPKDMVEAALDLGATPAYALRKVVIPQIMPGIVTGALMAFTLSIDDFVISFFTTGSGVTNLSITIYSMARRGINPKINALSSIMFLTVLVLLVIINKRTQNDQKRGVSQ